MTPPSWLNDLVRAFGRQMGLSRFELTERGVAGVQFENGFALRFEYAGEALMLSIGQPVPAEPAVMRSLLAAVHPGVRLPVRLRAAYLAKSGEAVYVVRIPERQVTVTRLESVFRVLWQAADRLKRSVA